MVLLLENTQTKHHSCERYQAYKDFDILWGNIELMAKKASISVATGAKASTFRFMFSRKFSNLFLIEFTFRYDCTRVLRVLKLFECEKCQY